MADTIRRPRSLRFAFLFGWMLLMAVACPVHSQVSELSADDIKALEAKDHSPQLKLEELKVFPAIRKYEAKGLTTSAKGEKRKYGPVTSEEKWVDGRYIVTTVHIPNAAPMIIVVTYDRESLTYRKWTLWPTGLVMPGIGMRDGDGRTLSWSSTLAVNDGPMWHIVSQETHADKQTSWTEVMFINGKFWQRITAVRKESRE